MKRERGKEGGRERGKERGKVGGRERAQELEHKHMREKLRSGELPATGSFPHVQSGYIGPDHPEARSQEVS